MDTRRTIDLHGLHVDEALEQVRLRIEGLRYELGDGTSTIAARLDIITGVGNHSQGHRARLLPAVEAFCAKQPGCTCEQRLPGIVTVTMKAARKRR